MVQIMIKIFLLLLTLSILIALKVSMRSNRNDFLSCTDANNCKECDHINNYKKCENNMCFCCDLIENRCTYQK